MIATGSALMFRFVVGELQIIQLENANNNGKRVLFQAHTSVRLELLSNLSE